MSAMQRNKGKAGEREAADLVCQFTGWDALLHRADRADWRAVWPLSVLLAGTTCNW